MIKIMFILVFSCFLFLGCLSNSMEQPTTEKASANISIKNTSKTSMGKLNSSFCQSLENQYAIIGCNEYVGIKENDQRIRDYIVYIDSIGMDMDHSTIYKKQLDDAISEWNSAENLTEAKEAYHSFFLAAKLYTYYVNSLSDKIDDFIGFLGNNKPYLDNQGINTQSEINTFKSFKTDLGGGIIFLDSYLSTMNESLDLTQQEQKDLDDLKVSLSELEEKLK